MKIKKSELNNISKTIDETIMFLNEFLDFANDDQLEYVKKLLDNLADSYEIINKEN